MPPSVAVYQAKHPDNTLLYKIIQENFETFLQLVNMEDEYGLPTHVEQTFRKYLRCGLVCYGFARARCATCGFDFIIPFSCKTRGLCPSCNTRRMAEIAAHLVDHVIPVVAMRQWVLTVPKRIRFFLQQQPEVASYVLGIFLRILNSILCQSSKAPVGAKIGAISFPQRFGSALNPHFHYHCLLLDGVYAVDQQGHLQYYPSSPVSGALIQQVTQTVQQKILNYFERQGFLEPGEARDMLSWEFSGFSVNASVHIGQNDRKGLERLIRYCARPPFSSQRLQKLDDDKLIYYFSKPQMDGSTYLILTPLELLEKLATFIPPPYTHVLIYHGVFAPNSPLRQAVTAQTKPLSKPEQECSDKAKISTDLQVPSSDANIHRPWAYTWAMLLARIFEVFPMVCSQCGKNMEIIAFITDTPTVYHILQHIGQPTQPPEISRARAPPWSQMDEQQVFDEDYDQTINW